MLFETMGVFETVFPGLAGILSITAIIVSSSGAEAVFLFFSFFFLMELKGVLMGHNARAEAERRRQIRSLGYTS